MRVVRLAQLFEHKYSFKSEAAPYEGKLGEIKKELINAYKLYCDPNTARPAYNILPYLAQYHEPNSIQIISLMKDMIDNMNNYGTNELFSQVNGILALIDKLQEDGSKKIRESIHDSFPLPKESERNRRTMAKSKWEQVVNHKFSSLLKKQAEALKKLLSSGAPIMGGPVDPRRRDLSKEKLLMFSRTPAAQAYGFDSILVLEKLLQNNQTREMLTTLINAVDRGHIPKDGPEIMAKTKAIKEAFELLKTNEDLFEGEEAETKRQQMLPQEEEWARRMQESKQEKALEREEEAGVMSPEQVEELARKRDEALKQKQIEEDRERHIRSEGSLLLKDLFKKRYL